MTKKIKDFTLVELENKIAFLCKDDLFLYKTYFEQYPNNLAYVTSLEDLREMFHYYAFFVKEFPKSTYRPLLIPSKEILQYMIRARFLQSIPKIKID